MIARHGEASATGRVNGGLNDRSSAKRPRPSSRQRSTSQTFAVTDGRTTVGMVEVDGKHFIAIDTAGHLVGRFDTLKLAMRAFDGARP